MSANDANIITLRELFDKEERADMIGFFPTKRMAKLIKKLPNNVFDLDEIIYNHTLFKYYSRMMPFDEKKEIINEIKEEKRSLPRFVARKGYKFVHGLRFCPICMKDDEINYGVAYWHVEHQLPLMYICRKHKCRLICYYVDDMSILNRNFILPSDYKGKVYIDYAARDYELLIAEESYKFQYSPFELSRTLEYNNIYQELLNRGYRIPGYCTSAISVKKLEEDLIEFYGKEFVENVFGEKKNENFARNLRLFAYSSPERYILTMVLVGQSISVAFGPKILDEILVKILKLKETGLVYKKEYLVKVLGIKNSQFNWLVKRYNIEPFWRQTEVESKAKKRAVYINEKDLNEISEYVKKSDYTTMERFLIYCAKKEIKEQVVKRDDETVKNNNNLKE